MSVNQVHVVFKTHCTNKQVTIYIIYVIYFLLSKFNPLNRKVVDSKQNLLVNLPVQSKSGVLNMPQPAPKWSTPALGWIY